LKQAPSSVDCWLAFWFLAGNAKMPRLDDIEEGVEAAGGAAAGAAAAGAAVAGAGCCA
jgi:hypothetical protein